MDKVLGPAYTGDPGVPHVDKDIFSNIFLGACAFALYSAADPYPWQHATQFNWHDFAYIVENHQHKRALRKKVPYKSRWNTMLSDKARKSYYDCWQDFFP